MQITGHHLVGWLPQTAYLEGAEGLKVDIERQREDIQHIPQVAILSLSSDPIASYPYPNHNTNLFVFKVFVYMSVYWSVTSLKGRTVSYSSLCLWGLMQCQVHGGCSQMFEIFLKM